MAGEFSISPDEARQAVAHCMAQIDRLDVLVAAATVHEYIDYGDCALGHAMGFKFADKAAAYHGFDHRVAQVRAELWDMAEKFRAIADGYAQADLDSMRWIGGGR
ncbi:hypothetical protein [Actinokineospora globicatena]|uniref:Excreted virulence factor EspC, type VII ESX diderm n=1 Tax=Actinokineospora globicatena TaxID=103729 RepID=A0A9W6QQM4_9PSEU|nr:hypothetical protein [Actinokineospora globicatena]MCP2300623.1 hypothetical protein [Actinokineospora globicatena]GLW81167.1 hypothetical protein Aglo01_56480 [Actinokineospora globicatena]GLW88360.1 hypothetical protein Aglo02_59990 [Actinokineospora globicatena]GLW92829.1 hypothetical protein Aglo03_36450 [Actinokineospora globicatena]